MYRLISDLGPFADGSVLKKGSLSVLDKITPKALAVLLAKGHIVEWQAPPLNILPGWQRKAAAFAKIGILTVSDLIEANEEMVAERLQLSPDVVRQCIDEVSTWAK